MNEMIDLALKYGGYTSLDRVYLSRILSQLTDQQALDFITPPPSVVNAYFAELYQKKSPLAAMDYLEELSSALNLFQTDPDFSEKKPFVRLNLSGKSYGLAFEQAGRAQVFAEGRAETSSQLLFEIAEIFPDHWVYEEKGRIYMSLAPEEKVLSKKELTALTDLEDLADGSKRLSGYSQEDILDLAKDLPGQQRFRSSNRLAMLYLD